MRIHGDTLPGFPSIDAFMYLLQPQLEKLKDPVMDCVTEVHMFLEQLAHVLIERIFYRFPSMINEIQDIVSQFMNSEKERTSELVEAIIFSEESYIFTNDQQYLEQRSNFIPKTNKEDQIQKDFDKAFVREMKDRLDTYFQIVIRNVRDSVPKTIGYFFVRQITEKLQFELYN